MGHFIYLGAWVHHIGFQKLEDKSFVLWSLRHAVDTLGLFVSINIVDKEDLKCTFLLLFDSLLSNDDNS